MFILCSQGYFLFIAKDPLRGLRTKGRLEHNFGFYFLSLDGCKKSTVDGVQRDIPQAWCNPLTSPDTSISAMQLCSSSYEQLIHFPTAHTTQFRSFHLKKLHSPIQLLKPSACHMKMPRPGLQDSKTCGPTDPCFPSSCPPPTGAGLLWSYRQLCVQRSRPN